MTQKECQLKTKKTQERNMSTLAKDAEKTHFSLSYSFLIYVYFIFFSHIIRLSADNR